IIYLARVLSKHPPGNGGYTLKELLFPLFVIGLPTALIIEQPDLGTGLALLANGGVMVCFLGVRLRLVIIGLVLAGIVLFPVELSPYKPAVMQFLKPYQQRRIMALFDPEVDVQGSGWHIHQSKIAVGSGQLLGKGYLQG